MHVLTHRSTREHVSIVRRHSRVANVLILPERGRPVKMMQMCEDLEEQMDVKAALDKDGVDTKRKWLAAARAESNAIIKIRN